MQDKVKEIKVRQVTKNKETMAESSRDPELAEAENIDEVRAALNLMCASTAPKSKPLPDRGTWSTKMDFILSVVS